MSLTLSPPMKKAVDAEIKKITATAEERKYVAVQQTGQTITAQISTIAGASLFKMLPPVKSGADVNQRIGNALTPKGIRTHFVMYFPNDAVNTANMYIRLLCISSREAKSYQLTPSLPGNNLFMDGAGGVVDLLTATYSDNLIQNQFLPVNKKAWIVHHDKIVHLAKGQGYTNNDTVTARTPTGYVPLCARFTLDTPHKGALKYDKPLDDEANNFAPYWCAYAWTADGGTAGIYPIKCDTRSDLYFVG